MRQRRENRLRRTGFVPLSLGAVALVGMVATHGTGQPPAGHLCLFGSQAMAPASPQFAGRWWTADIRAGSVGEISLLRKTTASIASDLAVADLGRPPGGFAPAPRFGENGRTWLYLRLNAADRCAAAVEANWKAMLVAGAYRDGAAQRGLPALLG